MAAIGIDLGTAYSCVGFFLHCRVDIIENDKGNKTTPSYVAFKDEEIFAGESAKDQVTTIPNNTVFDAKRMIGHKFSDLVLQKDMQHWPFKVVCGDEDKPLIEVQWKGETKQFHPEEILAMILEKMKEVAETQLKERVTDAVIAVPVYFNDGQRQAIKDASTIAGLNVLRIISEPVAATLAFGFNKRSPDKELNVLVFDLGSGFFSVSLVNTDGGNFDVKAIAGDPHLGGDDFDLRMVNYFADRFPKKFKCDLRQSPHSLMKLREECEKAKILLSTATVASINCDSLYEGHDFKDSISRDMFECLNDELFVSTMKPVAQVLKDANISKSDVTDIVLVGGSSRIPRIQQILQDFFDGKQLCSGVNPDESVAFGAALYAAIIKGDTSEPIRDICLLDVLPFSLGIETDGGIMTVLIPRYTSIPAKKSQIFSTTEDNQPAYTIKVYEGNHSRTCNNNLLGEFDLTGIQPAPKGVPQIEVTFDFNADGIMIVSAQDKSTGNIKKITIKNEKGHLSQADLDKMVEDAKKIRAQKEEVRKKVEAKNALESYCIDIRKSLSNEQFEISIPQADKETINKEINDALAWIDAHQDAEILEFENKQKELERKLFPILQKAYKQEVKHSFEGYCLDVLHTINDSLAWIHAHQDSDVSEYENKKKELEENLKQIIQKLQEEKKQNIFIPEMQTTEHSGPRVEEVD